MELDPELDLKLDLEPDQEPYPELDPEPDPEPDLGPDPNSLGGAKFRIHKDLTLGVKFNFHLKLKFRCFNFKLKHQEAYTEGGGSPSFNLVEEAPPNVTLTSNPTSQFSEEEANITQYQSDLESNFEFQLGGGVHCPVL